MAFQRLRVLALVATDGRRGGWFRRIDHEFNLQLMRLNQLYLSVSSRGTTGTQEICKFKARIGTFGCGMARGRLFPAYHPIDPVTSLDTLFPFNFKIIFRHWKVFVFVHIYIGI